MYSKIGFANGQLPAINATNLNKIDVELYKNSMLYSDNIQGTTVVSTITSGNVTKLEHKETGNLTNIIRTDNFTYSTTQIIEVRTLNTSETVTFTHSFDSSGNYTGTVVS